MVAAFVRFATHERNSPAPMLLVVFARTVAPDLALPAEVAGDQRGGPLLVFLAIHLC